MAKSGKIEKVLVANRGEIAVRVIRGLKELGIGSVAIYSEADRHSLHVRYADEAYPVGPAPSRDSYLNMDNVLGAVKKSGAHAVHPGYGFLSENPEFVKRCEKEGIIFIGPPAHAMEVMGSKTHAREAMEKAGMPIMPGAKKPIESDKEAEKICKEIGYPVLIKAVAGGGGKGMRIVKEQKKLSKALERARSEASSSFGDDSVYIEKYLKNPHHVEIQIMVDGKGNALHFFERECSVQRRYQKVIEEAPSPTITDKMRKEMGEISAQAAKKIGYRNAGTFEYLVDKDKNFYFLEMNTRLQVEHPVTELTTGVDLLHCQICVARGEKLPFKQEDIKQTGSSIECRIYAEDPAKNFMPSPGIITGLRVPGGPGVRLDTGIYNGYEVSMFYDPLIAKLVVWGINRDESIKRMSRALEELQIKGIKTNTSFLRRVILSKPFSSGKYDTGILADDSYKTADESDNHKELAMITAAVAAFRRDEKRASSVNLNGAVEGKSAPNPWKMSGRWAQMNTRKT